MFFKNIRCLLLAFSVLACTSQAFAGPNANATVSIDLIADGGAGNQMDDGVTSGTVSGQGTKIAVEVFAKGVVGIPDFLQFVDHFGTSRGGAGYDAKYDLDGNGAIGIPDFLIFVDSFGSQVPPSGGGGSGSGGGSGGSPDLIVESPSVSDSTLTTGQSFTLSATVRNQGNGSSAATTLRYYQSSNATISTSDTEVGTDSVSGLSASGTSAESVSLNAPSSAGTYYYGACVNSVTGESDTNNNCSDAVAITVSSSSGNGSGGGGSGDAITGSITGCSGSRIAPGLVSVSISGTVRAHREVSLITISGYANGQLVGIKNLNAMSPGQSRSFFINGIISTHASSLSCRVSWSGTVQGKNAQGVVDER